MIVGGGTFAAIGSAAGLIIGSSEGNPCGVNTLGSEMRSSRNAIVVPSTTVLAHEAAYVVKYLAHKLEVVDSAKKRSDHATHRPVHESCTDTRILGSQLSSRAKTTEGYTVNWRNQAISRFDP